MSNPFQAIYQKHAWGGQSRSGPGSDVDATKPFREYLDRFLREHDIRSVVDVGCGDWTSSQLVDWHGAEYLGLDVVAEVVEANRQRFGRPGIRFEVIDLSRDALPSADLVICKDVLQHVSNDSVRAFLANLSSFRFAILVNDIQRSSRRGWRSLWRYRPDPMPPTNSDILPGQKRDLRLLEAPFTLDGTVATTYVVEYRHRRWKKEVIEWQNKAGNPDRAARPPL